MDSSDSSAAAASQQPHLPPGFRFHPTDEELVVHYLKKKAASAPIPVSIIADIDLYKFDPWELPDKATFGEHEWYFFSPRDRKYPNGARPNRAATSGYWKATGTDKPVMTGGGTQKVGVKKALVFYGGKPPKGIKTNWIMHEYRLADNKTNSRPPGCGLPNKKASLRLDDWVLCRIYKKNNAQRPMDHDKDDSMDMIGSIPPQFQMGHQNLKLSPLKASNYAAMLESEQHLFDGMLNGDAINGGGSLNHLNPSHSKPQLPMAATAGGSLNGKRSFPNLFWNEDGPATSSSTKRFLGDGSNEETNDQNGSFATLLSQQSVLGSLGDGVIRQSYQLPGLNWYA